MTHHAIYVPGLGDHRTFGQDLAIKQWRLFGVRPHYLALGWTVKEGFDTKLNRLLELVESLELEGQTVSLVGASAGASAIINAYAAHKSIHRVVCISGKIVGPETIDQSYFDENPDFEQSVFDCQKSLESLSQSELANIMSTHPWRDRTVPITATKAKGTVEKVLPGWSHATGIFFGLTLGVPSITKFIRREAD